MSCSFCAPRGQQSHRLLCFIAVGRGTTVRVLAGWLLLNLVLCASLPASLAWGRDAAAIETADSEGNARAVAIIDAVRALMAVNPLALDHVTAIIAALGEHNRDALRSLEVRFRQGAADHGGPVLERWIRASREEALREGSAPIPPDMKAMLGGFFPQALLDRVRYQIGAGSSASLQGYVFGIGDTKGITLDEVIVFRDAETAADPLIWAHELAHVQQYERWGTLEFAQRYLQDFAEVEGEAWRVHGRYKSWAQRNGMMAPTDPATMWER